MRYHDPSGTTYHDGEHIQYLPPETPLPEYPGLRWRFAPSEELDRDPVEPFSGSVFNEHGGELSDADFALAY